jgi:hypothetical protein
MTSIDISTKGIAATRVLTENTNSGPFHDDEYSYFIENGQTIGRYEYEARGWLQMHPEYLGRVYRDLVEGGGRWMDGAGDVTELFFNMEDDE